MLEIFGVFFVIFLLILPFLIMNLFQKIKDLNSRIDRLNKIVGALRDIIDQTEKGLLKLILSRKQCKQKKLRLLHHLLRPWK